MIKKLSIIIIVIVSITKLQAQQDLSLSMYMFNPLFTNPATAGYQDKPWLSGIFRYQWVGIEGAPRSGVLSYQTPLKNKNIAVGALAKYDKLGLMNNIGLDLSFAYRLQLNEQTRLSLGLMGSIFSLNDDRLSGISTSSGDNSKVSIGKILPNFGFGAYLFSKRYFLGASVPHVLNLKIADVAYDSAVNTFSKIYNHYFASAGYVFGKETGVKFKPTAFFKLSQNSSPNIDLNANLLFQERFWVGLGYRSGGDVITESGAYQQFKGIRGESIIAMFKMMATERLEIGYAYDFPLSNLKNKTSGSHELYVGYDLGKTNSARFVSPRYVNYF